RARACVLPRASGRELAQLARAIGAQDSRATLKRLARRLAEARMARLRDKLVAHGEQLDELIRSLNAPGMALTLLFAGGSGIGKRFAARAFAQAMLCERSREACGECGSCLRVEAGT